MILLASALAGYAVLALEILGVHWLAPWFGSSALVWSNQIGVVLLAMALGGWLGGRAARTHAAPLSLAGALLGVSGLLIGAGIWLLPALAGMLLPDQLTLDAAAKVFLAGSFTSAIVLFAPPVLLLSMVSPLLVEARVQAARTAGSEAESAGSAAGVVGAAGTIGSLFGVFGSSLLALPLLGTRTTLALTALALLAAGALLLRASGGRKSALLIPATLLPLSALFASDPAQDAHLFEGAEVLAVEETSLQRLRVLELAGGERWLQMNEGVDSFQSIWFADGRTWTGAYYDLFALAPLYAECPVEQQARFWILGCAAGSMLGPVDAGLKGTNWRAVGVEIDSALVDLVQEWMPLAKEHAERLRWVRGGDARSCLQAAPDDLDFILLDAYANQFEIPQHLATEEFFAEIHSHLRDGGVLAINVGTSEQAHAEHGVTDAIRLAVASSFGENQVLHQVPRSRNQVLFARKGQALAAFDAVAWAARLPEGAPAALAAALLPGQSVYGAPSSAPYRLTDDRNPLIWEQARLWWSGS